MGVRVLMELHPNQEEAVNKAIAQKFTIITGGAGTGKTTIINEIANRIGGKVKLCAFAGKAAARMKEATNRPASTIHRMLGWNGERFTGEPLTGSTVIIDEASMVPSDLMAMVMSRNPTTLILVGDQAQLAPVGRGQPFHDLIGIRHDLVANLTHCYRNQAAVYKAASAIREGEQPSDAEESDGETWQITGTGDKERTHNHILQLVRQGYFDFERDIILVPRNGAGPDDPCTVRGLNQAIVDIVNPRETDEKWRAGDRVINTKNQAEHDVWNGTTGTIHEIDQERQIWVRLDVPIPDDENPGAYKDIVLFNKEMRQHLQLAYALSVHKSQGSQYRRVMFVALQRDTFSLLSRSLIYTAVTRTREECTVVGQINAFRNGIQKINNRRTVLQELSAI